MPVPQSLLAQWRAASGVQPTTGQGGPGPDPYTGQRVTPEQMRTFISGSPVTPAMRQQWANSRPGQPWWEDVGRSIVSSAQQAGTQFLNLPQQLGGELISMVQNPGPMSFAQRQAAAQAAARANFSGPSAQDMNTAVQRVTGPYHRPQTLPGKIASVATQMAPAAIFPADAESTLPGAVQRFARVAAPTGAYMGADKLFQGTPYQGVAGTLAATAAGAGVEAAGSVLSSNATLGRQVAGLTEAQRKAVIDLRQNAKDVLGIDLSLPEAVAHVTGGATNLPRLLTLTESSPRTAPKMQGYFANRPGQVEQAVNNFTGQVAPGDWRSPTMLGSDAQDAAKGVMQGANAFRSNLSGPSYDIAGPQTVDPQVLAEILGGVQTGMQADRTGLLGSRLGEFGNSFFDQNGKMITDVDNLSRVRNHWRDRIDLPPGSNDSLLTEQSGAIGAHLKDLESLLATNPNWGRGQQLYGAASNSLVNPIEAGPVGKVGATGDLGGQLDALFPRNPYAGQPIESGQALAAMGQVDPSLSREMLAQHVSGEFDQASRGAIPDQFAGPRFIRNVAGNPTQAATLGEGMNVIDPSGSISDQFNDLTSALHAMGWRNRPGMKQAFNTEDQGMFNNAPLAVRALTGAIEPFEWGDKLKNLIGRARYGQGLDAMANGFTDPNTAGTFNRWLNPQPLPIGPPLVPFATNGWSFPAAQQGNQAQ